MGKISKMGLGSAGREFEQEQEVSIKEEVEANLKTSVTVFASTMIDTLAGAIERLQLDEEAKFIVSIKLEGRKQPPTILYTAEEWEEKLKLDSVEELKREGGG